MSEIHNQLVATHEQLDLDEAQDRVQRILHGQAGPTLTPAPVAPPQAPAKQMTPMETMMRPADSNPVTLRIRRKRSDAGIPKKAPADPDEIVLRLSLNEARSLALHASGSQVVADYELAKEIQDQIIGHLQKRLDSLTKQK